MATLASQALHRENKKNLATDASMEQSVGSSDWGPGFNAHWGNIL